MAGEEDYSKNDPRAAGRSGSGTPPAEDTDDEGAAAAAAGGASSKPPPSAFDSTDDAMAAGAEEPWEEEMVEMPEDYLRWLLAQTRETDPVPKLSDYSTRDPEVLKEFQEDIDWLQAAQDEFFEYQRSVREQLEKYGRVMIPAAAVGPTDQFQEAINEYWYGLLKEYDNAGSKTEIAEPYD